MTLRFTFIHEPFCLLLHLHLGWARRACSSSSLLWNLQLRRVIWWVVSALVKPAIEKNAEFRCLLFSGHVQMNRPRLVKEINWDDLLLVESAELALWFELDLSLRTEIDQCIILQNLSFSPSYCCCYKRRWWTIKVHVSLLRIIEELTLMRTQMY